MFNKEPAFFFNGLAEMFRLLIPLLLVFGVIHWTQEQIAAVFAFSSVLLTFLATMFTRSQSVSNQTADEQIVAAKDLPTSTSDAEAIRRAKAATK